MDQGVDRGGGERIAANQQRMEICTAAALAAVKDKPFGWPPKRRPSLTAARHDGAVELRSGRKNGFAEVKQKNSFVGKSHADIS